MTEWDGASSEGQFPPEAIGTLLDELPSGVFYARAVGEDAPGADYLVLAVNPALERITGLRDVVGRRMSEVIPELFVRDPELLTFPQRVLETGRPERFERYVHALQQWYAIRLLRPSPGHLLTILDAVTDAKRAEAALRRQKQVDDDLRLLDAQFARVLALTGSGLVVSRLDDGVILDISDPLAAALGFEREEAVGRTAVELGIRSDASPRDALVRTLDAPEGTGPFEAALQGRDGSVRWYSIACSEADIAGERCLVSLLHDVSSKRESDRLVRESLRDLRVMFDLAPAGIAELEVPNGRFRRVNPRLASIAGRSPSELLGLDASDVFVVPDAAAWRRALEGEPDVPALEAWATKPDGSVAWVELRVVPLTASSVGATTVMAIVEDVTERRAAEHARRLQTTALDAAADGIVITDTDGIVHWANAAFSRMSGYASDELLGKSISLLRSGKNPVALYADLWRTVKAGEVWRGELVNRRKDGGLYPEEMTITPVKGADGAVTHFVAMKQDISERRRIEDAQRASEERYRALVENLEDVVYTTDADGVVTFVNPAIAQFGYRPDQLVGRRMDELRVGDPHPSPSVPSGTTGERGTYEWKLRDAQGKTRTVRSRVRPSSLVGGAAGETGVIVDLTRQRETEEQLRAAQRLEAIGRLAGGIAHDFNNLLTVILTFTADARDSVNSDDPLYSELTEILDAAERAATLTRQLLAFSRRQVFELEVLDLSQLVDGLAKMARRLIGEDIQLVIRPDKGLHPVHADRGQVEQVLMNLVVNARDAMPAGGTLEISTRNVELDPATAAVLGATPGSYAVLTVSDTGSGMDAGTMARIFEPFFTTKGLGKGTGLGLSTVYGIVKQSNGAIDVESTPGMGTTFRVYMPRHTPGSAPHRPRRPTTGRQSRGGSERILVVEDEDALRKVTERALRSLGYEVLVAASAEEALPIMEQQGESVALVLTDVVMPGIGGYALAERLATLCPKARVLFMSGYAEELERHDGIAARLLRKPFDRASLAERVRRTLDEPGP